MFEITPYNKISLTKGDTAAFNCEIVDLDGKERTPQEGDVLTLSLDDTDFSIVASNNAQYLFSISGADTANLEEGVYLYRVVLDTADGGRYTIFQNNIFDLLVGEAGEQPEPEHIHNYDIEEITSATCTNEGYTTHTCSVCGDTYTDDYTPALGHNYRQEVTSATCTSGGYTTHICIRCGDSYTDSYTAALGHNYVDGYCTRCGAAEPLPETLTASITFNDPSCYVGENVTVSMNIQGNTEMSGVQIELYYDMTYLEYLGVYGSGLGNLVAQQERDGYLTILDYAGTRADELSYIDYQIMFRTKQVGAATVSAYGATIVNTEGNTFDVDLSHLAEITIYENNNLPEEP